MKTVHLILVLLSVFFFVSCGKNDGEIIILEEGKSCDLFVYPEFRSAAFYPEKEHLGAVTLASSDDLHVSVIFRYKEGFLHSEVNLFDIKGDRMIRIESSELNPWQGRVEEGSKSGKVNYSLRLDETEIDEETFQKIMDLENQNEKQKFKEIFYE